MRSSFAQSFRVRWSHMLLMAAIPVIVFLQLFATNGFVLARRHLWLDELHTYLLVADPDFAHSLQALGDGADYNPPGLFLMQRLVTGWLGEVNAGSLRLFSFLCIVAGLWGVYACLTRRFSPWVALAAVLATWSHPLVLYHAFEARFYAPWFAAIAWFCFFQMRPSGDGRTGDLIASCLLAAAISTLHYFGIISVGLVSLAALIAGRPNWKSALFHGLPPAVAFGALCLCLPFYHGQRAALSVSTWVPSPSITASAQFLFALWSLHFVGLTALAVFVWRRFLKKDGGERPGSAELRSLAGMGGLLLMPAVLIAFSYLVQPSLVHRYAIVTLVGTAAAIAFLAAQLPRPLIVGLCLYFVAYGTVQLNRIGGLWTAIDRQHHELADVIREQGQDAVVLFESRHDLYPILHYAGDVAGRCYYLDCEPQQLDPPTRFRIVERDVARRHARHYPRVRLVKLEDAKHMKHAYLVRSRIRAELTGAYPGFELLPVDRRVYKFRTPDLD